MRAHGGRNFNTQSFKKRGVINIIHIICVFSCCRMTKEPEGRACLLGEVAEAVFSGLQWAAILDQLKRNRGLRKVQ